MNAVTSIAAAPERADVEDRVLAIIAKELRVERAQLVPEATLADLEVDSLGMVMILNGLEDEFGVYVPVESDLSGVQTLGGFLAVVVPRLQSQTA